MILTGQNPDHKHPYKKGQREIWHRHMEEKATRGQKRLDDAATSLEWQEPPQVGKVKKQFSPRASKGSVALPSP